MSGVTRIGLVGCGDIARKGYCPFVKEQPGCEIVTCTDVRTEVARQLAADFGIPKVCSLDELLNDENVDVVLNLTHPAAHAEVNLAAIEHGKHAYCEKPFALNRAEGRAVLTRARELGKQVGCAPDTVLGPGTQAARLAIDAGAIGEPVAARLMWGSGGHESWHPNPEFYYKAGGGPMLDMGPYYLSALVHLLGPIRSVTGRTKRSFATRTITSDPLAGTVIDVDVPTHYSGVIETVSGVHALVLMSFDLPGDSEFGRLPEIVGSEGTLRGTDPNAFDGEIAIRKAGEADWTPQPSTLAYAAGRGLGLLDLADAVRTGRKPRASGELAYHVLDAMLAFEDAEQTGQRIVLESTCDRPEAMSSRAIR